MIRFNLCRIYYFWLVLLLFYVTPFYLKNSSKQLLADCKPGHSKVYKYVKSSFFEKYGIKQINQSEKNGKKLFLVTCEKKRTKIILKKILLLKEHKDIYKYKILYSAYSKCESGWSDKVCLAVVNIKNQKIKFIDI